MQPNWAAPPSYPISKSRTFSRVHRSPRSVGRCIVEKKGLPQTLRNHFFVLDPVDQCCRICETIYSLWMIDCGNSGFLNRKTVPCSYTTREHRRCEVPEPTIFAQSSEKWLEYSAHEESPRPPHLCYLRKCEAGALVFLEPSVFCHIMQEFHACSP